jgi:hypothetical protein
MTALHPLARRVEHPAPQRHRVSPWLVTFGLFAAPTAWLLQFLISYGLNGDRCAADSVAQGGPDRVVLAVIGCVALAICVCALWAAHRTWRLTQNEGVGDHHEGLTAGVGRTRFLGLCGLVAGAIFLIATLFALFVPFLTSPCVTPLL